MQHRPSSPGPRGALSTQRRARPRAASLAAAGFTLIEVLVAILVLSFGMLGVVGLQVAAMQANKEARYQSAAVRLGREYAEMMRANNEIARVATAANNPYRRIAGTTSPPAATNCLTASCGNNAAGRLAVARFEVFEWFERASAEFPQGLRYDVCFDTTPYDGDGRPVWDCTAPGAITRGQPAYVKIGWTVQKRASDGTSVANVTTATANRPMVVVPVQLN